jgi:hypothetical protein
MTVGDINKKIGWIFLLIFLFFGFYLGQRYFIARAAGNIEWLSSWERKSFMMTHTHGLGLGLINILYGMTIDGVTLSDRLKRSGSYLAVAGTLLMPITIITGGQGITPYRASAVGGMLVIIAVVILVYGLFQKKD